MLAIKKNQPRRVNLTFSHKILSKSDIMKKTIAMTIWLAVIFLGGGRVNCFVNQITETVFEMDLIEMGVEVKEIIEVDLEDNLVITTVPQHHNRVAKKSVYDANSVSTPYKHK